MDILNILKFIVRHPLSKRHKFTALKRLLMWQIGSRLVPGAVAINFVNDARLLVSPGMTGATGNIYTGLHEFEDMTFLLHLLRPGDLFVDVGANIGSYTILASAAIGAQSLSIEPLPQAFRHLSNNICLNDVNNLVHSHNLGIGKENGNIRFTTGLDTINHVASNDEIDSGNTLEVNVVTLDSLVGEKEPKLIKIDVEGFEANVIAGAERTLANPCLDAVIMELNGSGGRYGFDETALHSHLLDYGFKTYTYSPFDRILFPLEGKNVRAGNTLYVRSIDRVKERLKKAPEFIIFGEKL